MLFDIVIVGGGIAGFSAALEAANRGSKVAIISKGNFFRSNSALASGGINAALGNEEEDSAENHISDTLKGSAGLGDKKAAKIMCEQALQSIDKLEYLGANFDKKDNKIAQRPFGGAGKKRTCYVADKTGGAIVQTYMRNLKGHENLTFISDYMLLNIIKYKDEIAGITVLNKKDSTTNVIATKSLILATGGYAGIYHGYNTNTPDSTGDGIAVALRAGLEVKNCEFVQFHPTGFAKSGQLVSEAARGEGGFLVNEKEERFTDELQTRDKLARAIAEEIKNGHKVYIDLRHLEPELIEKKLPSLQKSALMQGGVDITKELLEIKPVAHYCMGGIPVNSKCQSELKGVYACGEVAYTGAHGANRLGGNSLLEADVFGAIAGREASAYSSKRDYYPIDYELVAKDMNLVEHIINGENLYNITSIKKNLGRTMYENVGIFRTEDTLLRGFDYIKYLRRLTVNLHCTIKEREFNMELPAILELRNMLLVAEATTMSALKREESRGSHYRIDYPEMSDKFAAPSGIKELRDGYLKIEFEKGGVLTAIRKFLKN
ncbi:MAG: L-aspartate oxidase [Campylobacterales bacterium]